MSGWALVLGLLVCLGFLAVVLQTGILPLNPFGGPDADSILAFFFWVTVVPLTIGAVVGAVLLVRTAPDLVRRQEIVGEVIAPERVLYRIPADGSYADYGFYYRLKVRDQRSGRVETFHVGSEILTSAGSSILYYLQLGDWVRLVVTPPSAASFTSRLCWTAVGVLCHPWGENQRPRTAPRCGPRTS